MQLKKALKDQIGVYMHEEVYFDEERLKPGYSHKESLAKAICESVCMIVVYSPFLYEPSSYCLREFLAMERIEEKRAQMLGQNYSKEHRMIIPIVIGVEPGNLPNKIKEIHYYDVSKFLLIGEPTMNLEYQKVFVDIAKSVNELYKFREKLEDRALDLDCDSFVLPSEDEARKSWKKSRPSSFPDITSSEKYKLQFKMLHALYTLSNGQKYTNIPFDNLYKELQSKNDIDQERACESFEDLRITGLVDSKALGSASITHKGIKEFESAVLRPSEHTANFPLHMSERLSWESSEAKKKEIETIQRKRRAFLAKAYELTKGSSMTPVSAFEIMDILGYDQKTMESIYYYLEDEGLIKSFAIGGKFTITSKSMERAEGE